MNDRSNTPTSPAREPGWKKIEEGRCPINAPSTIQCWLCDFGHFLDCHYPLRCADANCARHQAIRADHPGNGQEHRKEEDRSMAKDQAGLEFTHDLDTLLSDPAMQGFFRALKEISPFDLDRLTEMITKLEGMLGETSPEAGYYAAACLLVEAARRLRANSPEVRARESITHNTVRAHMKSQDPGGTDH